ncbi:MAG: CapA family protein, partial [Clostridia bacterium]|nr:CapA family protein [Clostridia bacterium]
YAQLLADCGVDVIIGEHPHVLQPMEWIEGSSGNKTLLTYSIGNFLSTMYNDYFMVGGMLSFDIVKDASGTRVENALLVPTMTFYDVNRANLSIYFLDDFTADLASAHGTNAHGATSLEQLRGYVKNAIPAEFLPESYQ